ncbi:hypothetical protein GCM10028808_39620 [Spirosoma migulaei]
MQGSVLYIDQKQGFIKGSDQSSYHFTEADWRGTSMPMAGQAVTFQPNGQSAYDVHPQLAQTSGSWGQANPQSQSTASPREVFGAAASAGLDMAAEAGRNMVAGAERLTGQSIPTASQTGNFFRNFLSFDRMISTTIITITYYIYLIAVIITGVVLIVMGLLVRRYGGAGIAFSGVLVLIFGPLWIRLIAEFLIVVFKIHERLRHIDEKTKA